MQQKPLLKYQKIIKVGNSLALTLDKEFVKQSKVKAGDIIVIMSDEQSKVITIGHIDNLPKLPDEKAALKKRESQIQLLSKFSPEFLEWVDETLEDDAYVFKTLSNL